MPKRVYFVLALLFGAVLSLGHAAGPRPFPEQTHPPRPSYAVPGVELPNGYDRYLFGMKRTEIISLVSNDTSLRAYDANFIEGFDKENWTVLVAVGPPLIDIVWFVFDKNEELYNIIVRFNAERFSYLEILNALQQKYGRSQVLGQHRTVWQDERHRIQLERGLHVKYLDLERFARISEEFRPELLEERGNKYAIFDKL